MIELQEASRFFGQFCAVNSLSLTVRPGDVLGLLGPNGAGKTTTIRLITGVLSPSAGNVFISGINIEENPLQAKQQIGYLPEQAPIWADMTVLEYLTFCGKMKGLKRQTIVSECNRLLQICALQNVKHVAVDTLSKGYKRRVGLAQALLGDPPILIMDEPTDGLDPNQKKEVRDLIRSLGKDKTIIISTHILEEVDAVCNKVAVIANGRLAFHGTPAEMREQSGFYNSLLLTFDSSQVNDKILAQLSTLANVTRICQEDKNYRLYLTKEASVSALLHHLEQLDLPEICSIITDRGHLDDVFHHLTMNTEKRK